MTSKLYPQAESTTLYESGEWHELYTPLPLPAIKQIFQRVGMEGVRKGQWLNSWCVIMRSLGSTYCPLSLAQVWLFFSRFFASGLVLYISWWSPSTIWSFFLSRKNFWRVHNSRMRLWRHWLCRQTVCFRWPRSQPWSHSRCFGWSAF